LRHIKEFAAGIGKANFLLVAEVAGADSDADRYLQVLGSNLDATLDIGEIRPALTAVAKGLTAPSDYSIWSRSGTISLALIGTAVNNG
jgi:hypothetical protein